MTEQQKRPIKIEVPYELLCELGPGDVLAVTDAHIRRHKTKRLKNIEQQSQRLQQKAFFILQDEDRRLVSAWNNHPYMKAQDQLGASDNRNKKMSNKDVRANLPMIRKAITEVGIHTLLESIELYFSAVEEGKHMWGGINHAFGTLNSFLHRMLTYTEKGNTPWWLASRSVSKNASDKEADTLESFSKGTL